MWSAKQYEMKCSHNCWNNIILICTENAVSIWSTALVAGCYYYSKQTAYTSAGLTTETSQSSQHPLYISLYTTNIQSCWVRDVALGFVNKCEHKGKGGCCKNPASTYVSDLYMFHISHNYSSSLEAVQILTGCRLSHQHSWGEARRKRKRRDFEHQTINLV